MTILGIDLGTTSVKVTLIDEEYETVVFSSSKPTDAYREHGNNPAYREQSVTAIFTALSDLLEFVGSDLLKSVEHVVVCGQMHGVVLWQAPVDDPDMQMESSDLITWEDKRCDKEFLSSLPKSKYFPVSSGFGCATIFWLSRHQPDNLKGWNCAGTVADLLVAQLGCLEKSIMSPQNAASWGYFNVNSMAWETDVLQDAGFPTHLLPKVTKDGEAVGRVQSSWLEIPTGANIYVALGDMQASVFACIQRQLGKAVVNVGTSSQLVVPLESASSLPSAIGDLPPALRLVPYFGPGNVLAVVASLNGGNVLSHFAELLQGWCQELGLDVGDRDVLWERLATAAEQLSPEDDSVPGVRVRPTLFGERHLSEAECCASVAELRPGPGLHLGAVYRALCRGLMDNLLEMMRAETLDCCEVEGVLGTGAALRQNRVLFEAFRQTFARWSPRLQEQDLDASLGAAQSVAHFVVKSS